MTEDVAEGNREIADLLPWYETGRLGPVDAARVAAALQEDPALRRELDLVREERQATLAVNQAMGAPSRASADRFFAQLDAAAPTRPTFWLTAFGERLAALRPSTLAFATIAALAIVVGQFGVIAFKARTSGSSYETASAPQRLPEGPTLLVAFQPAASLRAVQSLLESERLAVVSGPSGGFFTVRVAGSTSSADLDRLIARLEMRNDVVRSALRRQAD